MTCARYGGDGVCPEDEHRPVTEDGLDFAAAVPAADGQLRLAGMGGVVGMDLPAVVAVVVAAGVTPAMAWLLAPFHEQGVVTGFADRAQNPEG